jgi:hypothetical protein
MSEYKEPYSEESNFKKHKPKDSTIYATSVRIMALDNEYENVYTSGAGVVIPQNLEESFIIINYCSLLLTIVHKIQPWFLCCPIFREIGNHGGEKQKQRRTRTEIAQRSTSYGW